MAPSSLRIKGLTSADVAPLTGGDETNPLLADFKKEFAVCRSQPDWCFSAQISGRTVGLLGCRAPDAHPNLLQTPETLIVFFLHCDRDHLEIGHTLMEHSLATLRSLGVAKVRWNFDSADFWSDTPHPRPRWEQQAEVARRAGFSLYQEKINYLFRVHVFPPVEAPAGLICRTLQDVGESAYIEAVQKVMQGTLDRNDAASCRQVGAEQAAKNFFNSINDGMQYEPRLWKLTYNSAGVLTGLIAPLKMWGDIATLGYVGVVPEHRGEGHGLALLLQCHADLQAEGIARVIADTDALNVPMQKTLEQAGYQRQGQSWSYEARL